MAVYALTLALALGAGILAFAWHYPTIALITIGVIGPLIFGVARGRNWARWTLALLTIAGLILTWPIVRFQLSYAVIVPLATAVQLALEALGLFLMFRPAAGRWFRRGGPAAKRAEVA